MSNLKIVSYPDPVLLAVGKPVADDSFTPDLASLVEDMFVAMRSAGGVGLAAPQVGISTRLFVMDVPETDDDVAQRHVFVNPEIVHIEGEQVGEEGCLSFPGLYQVVKREMRVIARAQNASGETFEAELSGLAARCVLHETDHCDGIVFLDRMTTLKREMAKRKIRALQNKGEWN